MKKLLIYILPLMLLVSCAKSLDDYNIDQKNPENVSAGSLFANALKELADNQTSPSVNVNVFRYWVQQWTATSYQDEPRYDYITREIHTAYWTPMYSEILQDLKESRRLTEADAKISAEVKNNRIALTEIVSVYTWSVLVNTWGDVPYSQALGDVNQPKYDKSADIYADLLKRLDGAIAQMTAGSNFGPTDLLYNDNTAGWIKFAHSLKLKLAITLADVDETTAKSVIQSSADKAFTSNADNATFKYLKETPNNNPISTDLNSAFTKRQDYIGGKPMIDLMNTLNDPRRPLYFTPVNGNYIGGIIGINNTFANFSHISDKIIEPDFPALLLDYPEVELILAEAAARWGITGTAVDHYNKGITASILYWGGSEADATTYLAQPKVAYATASANIKEKIGIQKYLALYNRGYDTWVEWRRLDFPKLERAISSVSVIPLRITYPDNERTLNQANVEAASAAMGGDAVSSKIFWDKF